MTPSKASELSHEFADQAARTALRATRNGMNTLGDAGHSLHERLDRGHDRASRYVRDEPVKALLVAAAAGAAWMALVMLWMPSRRRD